MSKVQLQADLSAELSRQRDADPRPLLPEDCLSFAEIRALALDPANVTDRVREHRKKCSRCSRLVRSAEQVVPHVSWDQLLSLLLFHALRRPHPDQRSLEYHLESCRTCRARDYRRLAPPEARVVKQQAISLARRVEGQFAQGYGAGPGLALRAPERCHAEGSALEVWLTESEEAVEVLVQTREPDLAASPVGCVLPLPEGGCIARLLRLSPDDRGWFAAETRILRRKSPIAVAGLVVMPLSDEEASFVSERDDEDGVEP